MFAALCAAAAAILLVAALLEPRRALVPQELARLTTLDQPEVRRERETERSVWLRLALPILRPIAQRIRPRWANISAEDLRRAGVDPARCSVEELVAVKILGALVVGAAVLLVATVFPGIIVFGPALAFAGFIAPSVYVRRRRAARRRRLLRELPDLIGLLKSFVAAGVTLEQALHLISSQQARGGNNLLAVEIRHALSDYGLGLAIDDALAQMAERVGIEELDLFAAALAQGKRQGAGTERILHDQEAMLRMSQRNQATAEASRIGTRLVGVLVGIYLPEFMLLIMVPLFYGIFVRAFN